MPTSIEWTRNADGTKGETWNPTTGCDRVSPGCDRCYALTLAKRLQAMGVAGYERDGDPRTSGPGFGLAAHPDRLDVPLRRRKPTTWFVNSMSDLFHPEVSLGFISRVWDVMERTPRHTYQILTKRPQKMHHCLWTPSVVGHHPDAPLPNVWLGTSIESDRYAWRANHLRATPAAVRFLSCEPLLGPLPSLDLTGISWVILGGESGAGAREMRLDWLADIVARCRDAGVPVFVKQDSGRFSGRQGRIPDDLWLKEMPRGA